MKVFTKKEYEKVLFLFPNIGKTKYLSEKEQGYYYEFDEENQIHNEHDKLYKKILERPEEMEYVIRKVTKIKRKLDIIAMRNELITMDFRGKQADVLYKLKNKEVYFLVEHQSTQDKDMAFRILEYETQIMDRSFLESNFKQEFKAKVISIVLYTGIGKWKPAQSILDIQEKFGYEIKPGLDYSKIGEYNLLDINKCTKAELLEDNTLLSKAMLLEKARKEEELIDVLEEIIPSIKENERAEMIAIIRYILIKDLGKEKAEEFIKKLEGGIEMGVFVNELRENREKELKKIKRQGVLEGKLEALILTAKNMLKEKFDVNVIEKVTGLKRNQFM